ATPGGESVSVRAECHRIYLDGRSEVPCVEGVLVSGVNCYEFPCVDVPQSCVFVIASNGQERFVRAEGTRSNLCTFVIDGGDWLTRIRVPNLHSPVVLVGADMLIVAERILRCDVIFKSMGGEALSGCRVPLDDFVDGCLGQNG